jgi:hypothetical protein
VLITDIVEDHANHVITFAATGNDLGTTQIRRILVSQDMRRQTFTHGNGLTNRVLTYGIRFLPEY